MENQVYWQINGHYFYGNKNNCEMAYYLLHGNKAQSIVPVESIHLDRSMFRDAKQIIKDNN